MLSVPAFKERQQRHTILKEMVPQIASGARYQTGMSADATFAVSATWTSGDNGMAVAALSSAM
jgi:hypothetical protein